MLPHRQDPPPRGGRIDLWSGEGQA